MTPVHPGQTAILVFSRTASSEAARKTFDPSCGKTGNSAIARRLIRRTLATAQQTRLPVFIHYDTELHSGTFGERLADATEAVFNQGYHRVMAIGNDCPDISASILQDAARLLQTEDLILGPAYDGGVYLIGIHRTAYRRSEFVEMPWESAQLQDGWRQYAVVSSNEIIWLDPLSDIDRASDFKALLVRLPRWSLLRKQLVSILASFSFAAVWDYRHFGAVIQTGLKPLRGPPVF